ncbi:hypothetical protein TcG_12479, partial [Trypanosoma cruzi]
HKKGQEMRHVFSVRSRKSTLCGSEGCHTPKHNPRSSNTQDTHARYCYRLNHAVSISRRWERRGGRRDSRRSTPYEVTVCSGDFCPVALRCAHSFLFGNIPSNVLSDAVNYSNLLGWCRSRFSRRSGDPVLECTHRSGVQWAVVQKGVSHRHVRLVPTARPKAKPQDLRWPLTC